MKIKLLIYLTLVAILLCGCSVKQAALPPNAPLIGKPTLSLEENKTDYMIDLPICNSKEDKFKAKIHIKGGPGEVLESSSGIGLGGESYMLFGIGHVKAKRTNPIYIKIKWRRGNEQGIKRFVIPPEQDNRVQN